MKLLKLKILIDHGAVRDCYVHPLNKNLCVKVLKQNHLDPQHKELLREVRIYERVKSLLPDQIAEIFPDLVQTDKGDGLICRLIRDEDENENLSQKFQYYVDSLQPPEKIKTSLDRLIKRIIMRDIFFLDFNLGNFVVQSLKDGSKKVWMVDIKSLNRVGYQGFLHLERIFAPLARIIMFRRIRRMYKDMKVKFEFDELCRKKFFSTIFVTVK